MAVTYHVAKTGADANVGTKESPFLTIGAAAKAALPGDTIIVHAGEYREWVKPKEGGLSNIRRITYQAAEGEKVVIKGSERIQGWEKQSGNVWKAVLPNTMFGDFNPYAEIVQGDWMVFPTDRLIHLGDVYLNGMSFYEAAKLADLDNPTVRTEVLDNRTEEMVPVRNPEQTKYLWYAEVDADTTTIYANFQGADPNKELVEANVRKCCFYPDKIGVNYLTVRGFEMAQAACPWAPPSGDQPGLIGAHWSKGWVIEDNIFHDAKCSAVSIGKEAHTGDNLRTFRKDKPGYLYQMESVFTALKYGWSKERIGSHIVRNNVIYDCGQNGIVGHLGCIFCEIYNNHIYDIALKREFYGHEIGGIKLHAAIDVYIHHNNIHDCSLGIWLDWQNQGTRVSKNLLYRNNRDLYIEVTHGPFLVDHNILGSKYSYDNHSQGGAYVRNLFAGIIPMEKILDRATPYHAPHSTDVAGYSFVYGGDDRYYQNIFLREGTALYDACPASLEEYIDLVDALAPGDHRIFYKVEQPVFINNNVYANGAKAYARESDKLDPSGFDAAYSIEESGGEVYVNITLPEGFDAFTSPVHDTKSLGRVRIADADFENPDGSPLTLDSDYFDDAATGDVVAGPFSRLKAGKNRIKVWG